MNPIIEKIVIRAHPSVIQAVVRDYSVEQLGYIYNDIIEDAFNVKRGTGAFGIAVSDLFAEYKVNKTRLYELDPLIRRAKARAKNAFYVEMKLENTKLYNQLVDEYNELLKPNTLFVKHVNKILKLKK